MTTTWLRLFQSTHPVRGGTTKDADFVIGVIISIHPPREGWDAELIPQFQAMKISIHPPREGWDANAAGIS